MAQTDGSFKKIFRGFFVWSVLHNENIYFDQRTALTRQKNKYKCNLWKREKLVSRISLGPIRLTVIISDSGKSDPRQDTSTQKHF